MDHQLGENLVRVEGDVLYSIRQPGWTLPDVEGYLLLVEAIFQEYGRLFVLSDCSQGMNISSEARRRLAEWSTGRVFHFVGVFIGCSLPVRALLTLVVRASQLFSKNPQPIYFCETLAEGWAIVARERARIERKTASVDG